MVLLGQVPSVECKFVRLSVPVSEVTAEDDLLHEPLKHALGARGQYHDIAEGRSVAKDPQTGEEITCGDECGKDILKNAKIVLKETFLVHAVKQEHKYQHINFCPNRELLEKLLADRTKVDPTAAPVTLPEQRVIPKPRNPRHLILRIEGGRVYQTRLVTKQ